MNKARRQKLQNIFDQVTELKDLLEIIKEEEEDYMENIPENLQGSERFEKAEETVEKMYEAVSNLEEAADILEEMIQ